METKWLLSLTRPRIQQPRRLVGNHHDPPAPNPGTWPACWLALALALFLSVEAGAQNLVQNGDFDTDVSSWVANSGTITHDNTEGSSSGPGSLNNTTGSAQSSARQCVTGIVGGVPHSFGADFRVVAGGPLNFCRVQLDEYDSSDCSGTSTSQLGSVQQSIPFNSATYTSLDSMHTFEATTASVRVRLDCDKNVPSHQVKWDDVYLLPPEIESTTYTLVAGQGATLYHLPGANGLLGDGDDLPQAVPTALIGSDPNYRGSFSYLAGQVQGVAGEIGLPSPLNRIAFLEGTVDFAPGVGFVGSNVIQTGHRQGFGIRDWFQLGSDLSGTFITLDAPFSPTGNSYVDNVLIPKAHDLGADGLLFADVTGTIPASIYVPFPIPVRAVVFGITGGSAPLSGERTAGITEADLSVTKTPDVTGLQAPGSFVTYTLTVTNNGPALADGIVLKDRIPPEVAYSLNNCLAPAPVGGIFTWSVGQLASGASATCLVTVLVQSDTNFDFPNAAIAFGEEWDSNLDDNISEVIVEVLDDGTLGVEQLPDQATGFSSDLDCDSCPTGAQGIADSFKVDSLAQICGLTFYGGYNDNTPFPDQLKIEIYDDLRETPGVPGVPGDLVATLTGAGFQTRFSTGQQIASQFDEYRYRVSILSGQGPILPRGRYWLHIINDSSGSGTNGDWFWESGAPDTDGRTLPGTAYSTAIAATFLGWGPSPNLATAFELCLTPFDNSIFSDGFESGDVSSWDRVVQ